MIAVSASVAGGRHDDPHADDGGEPQPRPRQRQPPCVPPVPRSRRAVPRVLVQVACQAPSVASSSAAMMACIGMRPSATSSPPERRTDAANGAAQAVLPDEDRRDGLRLERLGDELATSSSASSAASSAPNSREAARPRRPRTRGLNASTSRRPPSSRK